jgi:hypothetical protein
MDNTVKDAPKESQPAVKRKEVVSRDSAGAISKN